MTTHILIVNEDTFKEHLEYMFIGTGNSHRFLFNNGYTTITTNHNTERSQALMVADCSRMRVGDYVIFYLQQTSKNEGGFFGLFKVKDVPFVDNKEKEYPPKISKNLQYRAFIEPYKVYSKGVSEWEALDEIKMISSPCQMLWSLIYRKLKGNRGNTMITPYEADRLISLIRMKNSETFLSNAGGFSYDKTSNSVVSTTKTLPYSFDLCSQLDISQRLYDRYVNNKAHEPHLQAFVVANVGVGTCPSLDTSLFSPGELVAWIGNEVSCGVGMQRMDIVISTEKPNEELPTLYVIELKDEKAKVKDILQMHRYIDWLSQYYIPNKPSFIVPVLLTKGLPKNSAHKIQLAANDLFTKYKGLTNLSSLKFIYYDYPQPNQINFHQ
ncbi:MAG: EVE domain-containing protein [Prevotella sp.]|nr:EVE domain-containing protein [Prevotella sp.]